MKFKRRLTPNANINLVPMIDVVFQLIIFFMVSTTFIVSPAIPVNLPTASSSEQATMTDFLVTVASDGYIYVKKEKYDAADFEKALAGKNFPQGTDTGRVVIEGDAGVSYGRIVQILDLLRRYGFKTASLKTLPPDGE